MSVSLIVLIIVVLLLVGALPSLTYRSASPVPPEIVNTTLVLPAGTTIV